MVQEEEAEKLEERLRKLGVDEPMVEDVKEDEADDDDDADTEGDKETIANDGSKQSRSEQKSHKAIMKLGLKPVIGASRINIERNKNDMFPRGADIRLVSGHPEVYEPCDDSFALVDALLADRGNLLNHKARFCMEIGCGSGYVITSLAIILGKENSGVHYFTSDINPDATRVTQKTLFAHGVHAEIINTNIASGLQKRLVGMMDVIVVNPPYVPTSEEEVNCKGITVSWAGGHNGRTVIDRILPVVDELLSDRGWLYMVTLKANNPSQICLVMRKKGYASRIVVQRSTEEESLLVIKFWREGLDDVNDGNITSSSLGFGSWFGRK
ncbi:hypothetical protein J5N97_016431 [Dioscorea zingiberensis]|uniref:Methyltransferase small domain-containing protein n=1 Tax=Dioscorea zingiberensis TaxID=325984 RepID=A0A9D5CJC8_9LILI|nr:hypothetical protein J5N97_016431 [Dioscorea zingiberensis]